jgi:superfamily II DNA/RNA helicase
MQRAIKQGADIIVGTCGKLASLVKSGDLDLSQILMFVLDEADRLVDGDNIDMVLKLFNECPSSGKGCRRLQVSR